MSEDKQQFINYVYSQIKENPTWIGDTVKACNEGLENAYQTLLNQKSEIEIALAFSLGVGCKKAQMSEYIKDKLEKARPHSLRWDWFLKEKVDEI